MRIINDSVSQHMAENHPTFIHATTPELHDDLPAELDCLLPSPTMATILSPDFTEKDFNEFLNFLTDAHDLPPPTDDNTIQPGTQSINPNPDQDTNNSITPTNTTHKQMLNLHTNPSTQTKTYKITNINPTKMKIRNLNAKDKLRIKRKEKRRKRTQKKKNTIKQQDIKKLTDNQEQEIIPTMHTQTTKHSSTHLHINTVKKNNQLVNQE